MKKIKQKLWIYKEVYLLKMFFENTPLINPKLPINKTQIIQHELFKKGYPRTLKSIRRKLYRLNLVEYKVLNEISIKTKCMDCNKNIEVKKRYYEKYKKLRCDKCSEINRRKWATTKNGKTYQKKYRDSHKK